MAIREARPELSWMAIGGWLGTLADPGGSRSGRARPLVAFAILGAVVVAVGELAAPYPIAATITLAAVVFGAIMARALGPSASTVGTMIAIVAALATAKHGGDPARDGPWFALGGASAVVLSSIVWPVWTHLPVRRAVSQVFRELADYVASIERCVQVHASPDDPRWIEVARKHPMKVRAAIERARATSLAVRSRRPAESRIGSNLRVLLGMAEAQFFVLVTVASELETSGMVSPSISRVRETYELIATSLATRAWTEPRSMRPSSNEADGEPLLGPLVRDLMRELVQESEASLSLSGQLDRGEATDLPTTPVTTRVLDWRLLRDAFSLASPVAHHAIRVTVASAVAVLVGTRFFPAHSTWITVTTLAVLQSDAGSTLRRAFERVIGTTLGAMVAIAITSARLGPLALGAIMFPLSIGAVVTRPRSYRLFTFFLTPVFVLVAMRTPGDIWVAAARAGDTVVGGFIALLAALLIFPRWEERVGLPESLTAMSGASLAYDDAVRNKAAPETIASSRLAAAASIARAEESFERALANPILHSRHPIGVGLRDDAPATTHAMELVTYARRLTLAVTALDTLIDRPDVDAASLQAVRTRVDRYAGLLRGFPAESESSRA